SIGMKARKIAETERRLKEEMGSSPRRNPAHRRAGCPSAEMKDELRKRKAADAAMSVAPPRAGSELASSWIGPKRSVVNSTFVAARWSDSNIKKSILQRIGLVPVRRRPRSFLPWP